MPYLVKIVKANPPHKYKAVISHRKTENYIRTVKFGAYGMSDFTKHHDEARKKRYLKRHMIRENWNDPTTAGFWSRWLLWNKTTLKDSKKDIESRFNIRFY